jgi:riboflavin kinase / FMN adenylyltransferase
MKVFRGLPHAHARTPCVLAVGNFDGVHRGHQALIARMRETANRLRLPVAVMTFEPHPREFFSNQSGGKFKAPARIANLRDKLQSLADAGVDRVIVEHFNASFAALTADEFVQGILVNGMQVRHLVVGEDFRYGAQRAGDVEHLRGMGRQFDFGVETMSDVTSGGIRISSSAVREALAQGDFVRTKELLGHPYMISGRVIHGRKLGRQIGFPTMNLKIAHKHPALSGIFVVRTHGIESSALPGVASLGVRPTIDDSGRVLLETHLFDFDCDIYGRLVRIEFLQKIRDEEKYSDLALLKNAIAQDSALARAYFKREGATAGTA